VKKIEILRRGIRGGRFPHRPTRFGSSVAKLLLLAGLIVSPAAEPMLIGAAVPPPAFQPEIVDQWGGFRKPSRIAVANDGRVYVADSRRGAVGIFDPDGRRVGTLTGVDAPLGLAVSVLNRCGSFGCACQAVKTTYVGDEREGSVSVFEDGVFRRKLGIGAGEFIKPNGIAVTPDQVIYVVDSEARSIKIFNPKGELHATFGSRGYENGQVEYPVDVARNAMTGELYVADYGNRRIAVYAHDGTWLRNLWAPLNDQGDAAFFRIAGVEVGPSGNLYIVDSALSSVSILTPDGDLVDIIGYENGSYWTGQLNVPVDAATDGRSLYVTSSMDRLVKVFGTTQ
jgi:DNA-binding beta-propeller fold protein YncE